MFRARRELGITVGSGNGFSYWAATGAYVSYHLRVVFKLVSAFVRRQRRTNTRIFLPPVLLSSSVTVSSHCPDRVLSTPTLIFSLFKSHHPPAIPAIPFCPPHSGLLDPVSLASASPTPGFPYFLSLAFPVPHYSGYAHQRLTIGVRDLLASEYPVGGPAQLGAARDGALGVAGDEVLRPP